MIKIDSGTRSENNSCVCCVCVCVLAGRQGGAGQCSARSEGRAGRAVGQGLRDDRERTLL